MSADLYEKIKNKPEYTQLVARRSGFAWVLAAIILVIYFTFILLVAFAPNWLAIPLFEGSTITIGIPIGLSIIVISFILTGIYVYKANTDFDPINERIIKSLEP
jgi:uncharacterized membrane protein (DUF485 family)